MFKKLRNVQDTVKSRKQNLYKKTCVSCSPRSPTPLCVESNSALIMIPWSLALRCHAHCTLHVNFVIKCLDNIEQTAKLFKPVCQGTRWVESCKN